MKIRVIDNSSPTLQRYGVEIGMVGECVENDFKEKYQYKVNFHNPYLPNTLYFFKEEVEELND